MHFNKRRGTYTGLLLFATLLLSTRLAVAHPMGNFSINHYAKITVDAASVKILYLLDFAEIPTSRMYASMASPLRIMTIA